MKKSHVLPAVVNVDALGHYVFQHIVMNSKQANPFIHSKLNLPETKNY